MRASLFIVSFSLFSLSSPSLLSLSLSSSHKIPHKKSI